MELIYTDKDGNQTKFTQDMVTAALDERAELRSKLETKDNQYYTMATEKASIRHKVFEFFNDRYDSGESEITCTVDDVNELLESIGAGKLKSLFTVMGTINFEITDIEADSEDDARDAVENYLTAEYSGEGDLNDWSVEVESVEQQ